MIKFYKFYNDAGHGWVAVKRKELVELGILDKISGFSYQKGNMVYLEEDCDASLFVKKLKELDITYGFTKKYCNYSPIRSYEHFKVDIKDIQLELAI